MRTAEVPTTGSRARRRKNGDVLVFPIVDDLATLTWVANLAALELHVHQWTVDQGRQGRRAPTGSSSTSTRATAPVCTSAARWRCWCATSSPSATSRPRPVTSGSKGLHLYAALPRRKDPDDSTALAKDVAEELAKEHRALVTATMTKSKRSGKVFLDWSQNAGSKTTLSPYSLRGRELPTVATPVTWDEVEAGAEDPLGLEQFRFEEVLERLADGR